MARFKLIVLLVLLVPFAGSAGSVARADFRPPPTRDCTCGEAKTKNGWCSKCGVGWVARVRVPSWRLFEALDAHGHDIKPESITCASCRIALARDGFCERSRMGFVKKQAYVSRLTHVVATNTIRNPRELDCAACAANARGAGWCSKCARGMVGALEIRDRESFVIARREFARLHQALELLSRCERCAIAAMCRGRCRKCRISYREPPSGGSDEATTASASGASASGRSGSDDVPPSPRGARRRPDTSR